VARKFYQHDDSIGRDLIDGIVHEDLPEPHFEKILAPVTQITIQHELPRRFVRYAFMDLDYYAVSPAIARRFYYGDNGNGTYYVTIDFIDRWSGVVRLDV
jgi:hypothetical protein